jgi:glyoxylase-like metal-dependent hydrolase (beta-lactamase superfamily II)
MKIFKNISVQEFYDSRTATLTYVVFSNKTRDAVIIDSVLDFDNASGSYWTESCEAVLKFTKTNNLIVHYILETHAHADHISGSQFLKREYPSALTGIGENITSVQKVFKDLLSLEVKEDGSQFDILFEDNERVKAGALEFTICFTPGHTPACTTLCFDGFVFCGDALFMPDYGTGRCDFPKGSASDLYDSITKVIYSLPDDTVIFVGHDYCPNGRELAFCTTVGESKEKNIRLDGGTSKESFVTFRSERDSTLSTPKLLMPSIQVNINAGILPSLDSRGKRFLKIPLVQKK